MTVLGEYFKKQQSGESSGGSLLAQHFSKSGVVDRVRNEIAQKEQERENERLRKQQEAMDAFNAKQQEIQQKVEKGNIFQKIGGAWQSLKQSFGRGETLPEIEGGSKLYQAQRQAQLAEQDYKKRIFARGSQAILDLGKEKSAKLKKEREEKGLIGSQIELMKGTAKNIGELASGTGKLALEFSPLTGMSGIRKLVKFVGGQKVEQAIDRNTPEYLEAVDGFIDNNGILNYKAQYNNEIQKTGGQVAEIGSWFIPITRVGKVGKIEKAISEIPRVARILNATPKVVKVGEKLMYEVSKDIVDVAILDAIRGKDWETIKEDATMAGIGGGILRAGGGTVGKMLQIGKNKRLLAQVEKSIPDMTAGEKEIAQQLAGEGRTIDDIATDIFAKREQEGVDIFKGLDDVAEEGTEAVAKVETPEATQKPKIEAEATPKVEKVETPKESPPIQEARKYKSAEEFVKTKKTAYHGGNIEDIADFDPAFKVGDSRNDPLSNIGINLGDKNTAQYFADRNGGKVVETYLDPKKVKKTTYNSLLHEVADVMEEKSGINYGEQIRRLKTTEAKNEFLIDNISDPQIAREIADKYREQGYDLITYKNTLDGGEAHIPLTKDAIKTKSQLTDIWNKSQPLQEGANPLIQETGKYKTLTTNGENLVEGKSVKIADGLDTFIHKDNNGNWVVSETSSGRSLNEHGGFPTEKHAIEDAKNAIDYYGLDNVKKLISGKSQPLQEGVEKVVKETAEEVEKKTSKIAKSIERKMKDAGMIDEGADIEKATYEGITVKGQAEEAAKIIQDKQLVEDIISGKKELSTKVRPSTFIKAVEDKALKEGDVATIEKLAKSKLAGETSISAQDLRMAAERDPDSAVIKIREIAKAREEALAKRLKKGESVSKAKNLATKEVEKASKTKKSTKATWSSFLEDIKC